ncbi:hypothetical protein TWF696_008826 [Orbilia brochopaga]|uniref:Uncharacterized protein n=1 Tax=Orbilia brochopaga TaxID=3140254 RepID=A0AAV9UHR9_9PEZI
MNGINPKPEVLSDTEVPETTESGAYSRRAFHLPVNSEIDIVLQYKIVADLYSMTLEIADKCLKRQDLKKAVQEAEDDLTKIIKYTLNWESGLMQRLFGASKDKMSLVDKDGQCITTKVLKSSIVALRENLKPKARSLTLRSMNSHFDHTWMTLRWLEGELERQRIALAEEEKENIGEHQVKKKNSARRPKLGLKSGLKVDTDSNETMED